MNSGEEVNCDEEGNVKKITYQCVASAMWLQSKWNSTTTLSVCVEYSDNEQDFCFIMIH